MRPAVGLKWRLGYDDSLDVVGVHLVGGAFGSIALGFLSLDGGLFYGGDVTLLGKQTVAVLAVGGFSFVVALVLGLLIDKTLGFRIDAEDESLGIDLTEHSETGYDLNTSGIGGRSVSDDAGTGAHGVGAPVPQDARHHQGSVNA